MDELKLARLGENLDKLTLSSQEAGRLVSHLYTRLNQEEIKRLLSPLERRIISRLISSAFTISSNYSKHIQEKRTHSEVLKILNSKGTDELKMRAALKLLGHSPSDSRKTKALRAKQLYEGLLRSYLDKPGSEVLYFNEGKYINLKGRTPREKKIAIIKLIREIVYGNSIALASVAQQLRRLKVRNLPNLQTPTSQ
jgi:hypothetical protein